MNNPAVVFTQVNRISISDVRMPPPAAGEVQVRADVSSISVGTEGWILRNEFTWSPTPYPCVPGYQAVGRVTSVGPGVSQFKVGDRVMTVGGDWPAEKAGGVSAFWGGHIQDFNVTEARTFHAPAQLDDLDVASLVVAQVGYNCASRPKLTPGDWVVVYGDGMIGQSAAQAARARGARVILVGHREHRLDIAREHSADHVLDGHGIDVEASVKKITGGKFVAAVLDTVQREDAQRQYINLLEPIVGQITYSGFTPAKAWADMGLLQQRELTTYFVAGWTRPRMEATMRLMVGGKMNARAMITHRVPYTRAAEMYEMILDKGEPFLGVAFDWK